MNWDALRSGFLDELEKISAISTRGLSTETVLGAEDPPPMETAGFQKARDILNRAQMMKTGASRQVQRAFPNQPGLGKMVHQGDNSTPEQAKSVAGYSLAGIGAGTAAHRLYSTQDKVHASMRAPNLSAKAKYVAERANNRLGHGLMVGGALAGAGYGTYRAIKKSRDAKAMMPKQSSATPAQSLHATQQVGSTKGHALGKGPSLRSQATGTIGNTGRTL
jgi:hypothetical protein